MRDILRLRCALGCVLALLSGALVMTADREMTFDRLRAAQAGARLRRPPGPTSVGRAAGFEHTQVCAASDQGWRVGL